MAGLSLRQRRRWAVALTLVTLAPLLVAVVHLVSVGDAYLPVGDWSLLEMRVRDVGHQWLTTGVYSRFGWYHPGPLLFYVLAVPYRLFGSRSVGVNIGGIGIGICSVLGCAVVAWRRGGLAVVAATLLPLALLIHAVGADQVQDPWNPYVSVLPFFLVLLLVWSVGVGDVWAAVALVAVTSFVVQAHVAYVVPCVPLLLLAGGGCAWSVRRGRATATSPRALGTVAAIGIGVAVVLWLPVLWGTLVSHDGNLGAIWRFSTGGRERAGLGAGVRTMALQWSWRPEWIVGPRAGFFTIASEPTESQWWLAPWLAVPVVGGFVAVRRRDRDLGMLVAVGVVMLVAGVLGVSRIVGPVVWYLARWTWAIGALLGVTALLVVVRLVPWSMRSTRGALVGVTIVLVGVSGAAGLAATSARTPFEIDQTKLRPVVGRVVRALAGSRAPVVIDTGRAGTTADFNLGLQLERRGYDVSVAPPFPERFGAERSTRSHGATHLWIVGSLNHTRPPRGARPIASVPGEYRVYLTGPSSNA